MSKSEFNQSSFNIVVNLALSENIRNRVLMLYPEQNKTTATTQEQHNEAFATFVVEKYKMLEHACIKVCNSL